MSSITFNNIDCRETAKPTVSRRDNGKTVNDPLTAYDSKPELNAYQELWTTVISNAIKDRDITYLSGPDFQQHCDLINLDKEAILERLDDELLIDINNLRRANDNR